MKEPKLLFIEAGHGKNRWGRYDPGAVGYDMKLSKRVAERYFNLLVGEKLLKLLQEKLPHSTVLGVGIETKASVIAKVRYMNKVKRILKLKEEDCYAVSLHVNASYNKTGIMGFYQNKRRKEGIKMLNEVLEAMKKYFDYKILGVVNTYNKKWYQYLRNGTRRFIGRGLYIDGTKYTNILVEMGYMGNQDHIDIITLETDRLVESIANGILTYFRSKE